VIADLAVAVLLVAGVAVLLLCCAGVVAMGDVYDRLHYTGPAGLGALSVCAAVLVRESFSLIGNKALFVGSFLLLASPLLVHVTARSARLREHGEWSLRKTGDVEVEEA
jgi:monovalent cation/proton antiporter MnhG/PhaG subunit